MSPSHFCRRLALTLTWQCAISVQRPLKVLLGQKSRLQCFPPDVPIPTDKLILSPLLTLPEGVGLAAGQLARLKARFRLPGRRHTCGYWGQMPLGCGRRGRRGRDPASGTGESRGPELSERFEKPLRRQSGIPPSEENKVVKLTINKRAQRLPVPLEKGRWESRDAAVQLPGRGAEGR